MQIALSLKHYGLPVLNSFFPVYFFNRKNHVSAPPIRTLTRFSIQINHIKYFRRDTVFHLFFVN